MSTAPTPRELLAQADRERAMAEGAERIRREIRLGYTPVIERRSRRWGWWKDRSTAKDLDLVEPIPGNVVTALYEAAGIVLRGANQRARDLEARVTAQERAVPG